MIIMIMSTTTIMMMIVMMMVIMTNDNEFHCVDWRTIEVLMKKKVFTMNYLL